MKHRSAYLLNTVFLAGLLVLAVNDHCLKAAFGNVWTGKLSDFAGVLILPLFLKYLTGWKNSLLIAMTVLFFIWFKSPFSENALDALNGMGLLHFSRVVDYTDLLAFTVLPLSYWVLTDADRFTLAQAGLPRTTLANYLIFPMCLFFFVATSSDEPIPFAEGSDFDCCAQEPVEVMVGNGYVYIPSAFTPDGDGINDFFQIVADSITRIDSFRVFSLTDSTVVFTADNVTDFSPSNGFDGMAFGVTSSTAYSFAISVTAADGTTRTLRNQVCALPCPSLSSAGPRFLSTCTFGTQINAQGRFDRTLDAGESLDCY